MVFAKKRGQERKDNLQLNLEEFIAVKGITAMGNQLTKEKVLEINALESLPYEEPETHEPAEIEVVDEEDVTAEKSDTKPGVDPSSNGELQDPDGQTSLF